jgi:L-asparaginase II
MSSSNPVLVEIWRGDLVESRHHGAAAIVDGEGRVVEAWGAIDRPVFARSAIKPLQALPLVETGAAERFGLGDQEVALACASHRGEPQHTERVAHWLARVGLGAGDLECGSHLPYHEPTAQALIRAGEAPSALHSNCSGKHSGFLTTAQHRGEPTAGYVAPDHPVQRRVTQVLQEMSGLDLARAPRGTDGCGIPVIGMSLHGMARAMARLADTKGLGIERAHAAKRILDAMRNAPLWASR